MKKQFCSLAVALCLLACQWLYAQTKPNYAAKTEAGNPTEKYLGSPDYSEGTQLIPVGIDLYSGNENNTIHYGRTPSGSSAKPVLVFVHGYASNATVFFTGDDNMYADVYRDGYRSAYVSLTPNESMWTNGAMLANIITRIKSHYNGAPIVMVGWSKGGVDIDAALVHYGARNKVSEVFTLSTPHFGTGIAEVANSVLLSLVNIIFMQNNNATLSLQRGYMNYFRSITDNNSNNTVPYTTIGGWGNGPLNRLDIPQGLLHGLGGPKSTGGNDGVVPYASSRRPGGKELFSGLKKYKGFLGIPYYDGPDQTNLDHFEVTRGSKVWPHIRNELNNSGRQSAPDVKTQFYNPNQVIASNMQWVVSSEEEYFAINSDGTDAQVVMISGEQETLRLTDESGKTFYYDQDKTAGREFGESVYHLKDLKAGRYYLLNENAVAFMTSTNGPELTLDFGDKQVMSSNSSGDLDVMMTLDGITSDAQVSISAYMLPVADLQLNRTESSQIPLTVSVSNGQYRFNAGESIGPGIYQLIIRAQGDGFRRDLLTSFAVDGEPAEDENVEFVREWSVYPNPASEVITIQLADTDAGTLVNLYTIKGEKISQRKVAAGAENVRISLADYRSGLYIVEVITDGSRTQKMVIRE